MRSLVLFLCAFALNVGCVPEINPPGGTPTETDADNDGYFADKDCDDQNAWVYPGAVELCDALDNDCDDEIDEDPPTIYTDEDGDGFGDPNSETVESCDWGNGESPYGPDCDDDDASIFPGATERCDSVDNDCDDLIDDADPDLAECESGGSDGVAVVYYSDSTNADLIHDMLVTSGYSAAVFRAADVSYDDLSAFSAIVVPPESGFGATTTWSSDEVKTLREAGVPILGMYLPGYYLFGSDGLELSTGYPYGATNQAYKFYATEDDHAIFTQPTNIDTSSTISVSSSAQSSKPIFWDDEQHETGAIMLASDAGDSGYATITLENEIYMYWSLGGYPSTYSDTGQALFLNCIDYLTNL